MQGSTDPNRKLVSVTCYLDESATEGQIALLGGCVLDWNGFRRLDERWTKMLIPYAAHGITAIHMTDFVRPHGKHAGLYLEFKLHIFTRIVQIIRSLADYTVSVSILVDAFQRVFSKAPSIEILSPYGMAFIGLTQLNIKSICLPCWRLTA